MRGPSPLTPGERELIAAYVSGIDDCQYCYGVHAEPAKAFGIAREAGDIERGIAAFATMPNGGLIVTGSALSASHRDLLVTLTAKQKLPTVYYERQFVAAGGLVSYGPDVLDQYRRAAGYVDRILKGEKASDLPVQAPTKYETVVNLKTAKALGISVPASLLARADEVIE
jgi:putative tryptophan/tyrosine transport system substrate-binding protein